MDFFQITAQDLMVRKVVSLHPDMAAMDALKVLTSHKIPTAPVLDANKMLVGMLSETDLLKLMVSSSYHNNAVVSGLVKDLMTTKLKTITSDTNLQTLASLFMEHSYRRLPVVDNEEFLGLVSRYNVLSTIQEAIKNDAEAFQSGILSNPKDWR